MRRNHVNMSDTWNEGCILTRASSLPWTEVTIQRPEMHPAHTIRTPGQNRRASHSACSSPESPGFLKSIALFSVHSTSQASRCARLSKGASVPACSYTVTPGVLWPSICIALLGLACAAFLPRPGRGLEPAASAARAYALPGGSLSQTLITPLPPRPASPSPYRSCAGRRLNSGLSSHSPRTVWTNCSPAAGWRQCAEEWRVSARCKLPQAARRKPRWPQ